MRLNPYPYAVRVASVGLLAFAALAGSAAPPAPATSYSAAERYWAARKPNLILILADDVRLQDLGAYGAQPSVTPHLDALAAGGIRLTQFYAGSPDSAPARAAWLTGRHPQTLDTPAATEFMLPTNAVTIAELLQPAGYNTGAIGQWGLGHEHTPAIPTREGFDEWLGYLSLEQAQDAYPTQLWRNADVLMLEKNFYNYRGLRASDFLTLAATNFARINKFKSFFLYWTIPLASSPPPNPDPTPAPAHSKAALARLDADVGKLLDDLERLKIEKHTLVIFAGVPSRRAGPAPANDGPSPETAARLLSPANLRVPFIARWTGKIPAGSVCHQPFAAWDVLPTAAALAEVPVPPRVDGISMLPTLLGESQTNHHSSLYWVLPGSQPAQALRHGEWHALRLPAESSLRLHHLPTDPNSTNNVARQHPAVVARLDTILRQNTRRP